MHPEIIRDKCRHIIKKLISNQGFAVMFLASAIHITGMKKRIYNLCHLLISTAVIVTGPRKPDGRGFHPEASNKPFLLFSLRLAGMLVL